MSLIGKIKEGDIRKALKARVESYGGEVRAVAWIGRKHAPDVLALLPIGAEYEGYVAHGVGGNYWIETKRPSKSATEAQAREHERMRAAGCTVLVVTCEAELDAWLPPL